MSQTKFGEGVEISFEEFLHQVMTQRFGFKKKIKQKTEQFLLGINIHAKNDERFDLIAKILGLDDSEQRYPKEILNTFIKIMNSTDENFMSLLSEEADTTMIETKKALKCSQDIFQNANNFLISSLVKEIFFESEIIIDNIDKIHKNRRNREILIQNEFIIPQLSCIWSFSNASLICSSLKLIQYMSKMDSLMQNRVSAFLFRIKRKQEYETLKEQVTLLDSENKQLNSQVTQLRLYIDKNFREIMQLAPVAQTKSNNQTTLLLQQLHALQDEIGQCQQLSRFNDKQRKHLKRRRIVLIYQNQSFPWKDSSTIHSDHSSPILKPSIIQALQERAESLENGLLDMVILRDLFWSMTREQDRNLMFGYENTIKVSTDLEQMDDFRNFVQKYFVKELQIVGQCEYLPTKRLKQFLKHKYEIKISVRQYMKKGLNFTLQMLDYCKFFLKKMYQTFDINQNGLMDLNEFENLIKKMMPEKPRWQVNAMFQAITNSIDYERKEISFEQFVNCAMINPLMKGILENTDIDSEILRKRLGHLKK